MKDIQENKNKRLGRQEVIRKEIDDTLIIADIKGIGWESFEDFIEKATEHMKKADAMYYNCVMYDRVKDIDEDKECQDALDKAIVVLQQAKIYATKFGF